MNTTPKDNCVDLIVRARFSIHSSNKYKADIATAAEKEEQLNEQRTEKLNRVKFVEKEKDTLEGGKREAELYLTTQNEVRVSLHSLSHSLASVTL